MPVPVDIYNPSMRVAWDLQAVTGPRPTGLGVAVASMLAACQRHSPEMQVVGLRPNDEDRPLIGVPDRLKWEQWRLPAALNKLHGVQPLDLCFSPALGAPMRGPVPVVAYVHDLIPLVFPESFSGASGWYWKKMLPDSWKKCRALIVSNGTVASEIADRLGYPRERIHIAPYYPDPKLAQIAASIRETEPDLASPPSGQTPPHFITLGSHEPRKNIGVAIRALGVLHKAGIAARLTCAGGHTPHTQELTDLAWKVGVQDYVEFPGYVERRAAVRLMLTATALVFASRYEGFGLPPLEAMSLGCPVVLSNIPCHRQVYGDSEAWGSLPDDLQAVPRFILPDDENLLATELRLLAEDHVHRAALVRSGLAYSALFNAERMAGDLSHALASALAT